MKVDNLLLLAAVVHPLTVSCAHLNDPTNPEPQTVTLNYDKEFPAPQIGITPVTPPGKTYKGFFMPGFTVSSLADAPSQPNLASTSDRSQLIAGGSPPLLVNSSTPYSSFDLLSAFVGCGLATGNGQLLAVTITCDYRLEARDANGNVRAAKVVHYTPANPATVPVELPGGLKLPPTGLGNPLLPQPRLNVSFTEGCEPCNHCTGPHNCDGFKNIHELGFILDGTTPSIPAGSQAAVAMDVDSAVVRPYPK